MSDVDFNQFDAMLEEANKEATEYEKSVGQYTNSGKLSVAMQSMTWLASTGEVSEVDAEEYSTFKVEKGKSGKWISFVIGVDIQELKPDLDFTYERKVQYRDFEQWHKILEPSVAKLFELTGDGKTKADKKNSLAVKVAKQLLALNGKYAFVNDVPAKADKKGNIYKYPALVAVFDSREEFIAAGKERFGETFGEIDGESVDSSAEDCPEGYSNFDEFAEVVEALRNDTPPMNNAEISKELKVTRAWVAKVK